VTKEEAIRHQKEYHTGGPLAPLWSPPQGKEQQRDISATLKKAKIYSIAAIVMAVIAVTINMYQLWCA